MISCPEVQRNVIRRHYDVSTLFYRLLWGPHIHHGLWHADESIAQAQLQLTDTLASLAKIQSNKVLDVGCGMGGSSIHLVRNYNCHVTGITLSRVQRNWAALSARLQRASKRTRFLQQDAEQFEAEEQSLDVIWSIECTEHLFDKAAFFAKAAKWLRPGGRIAICAWLAGATQDDQVRTQQVIDVCEGFFCPSLGTMDDYRHWFEAAGLKVTEQHDWTSKVMQTWEICRQRVARSGVRRLAPWIDADAAMFLDRFDTILNAYQSGAMQYGCFVAEKP
ncbi:MAG: class I SAM-dependent methyltransferase [Pirellulaceae bacterium]